MKCHDWMFLMFTTIACCMATSSIGQAQQRGKVKFGVSPTRDESAEINVSSEVTPRASRSRVSVPRSSNRFRNPDVPTVSSSTVATKEISRNAQRGSRSRLDDRSSRKLNTEASELMPSLRTRKRMNPVPQADQPAKVQPDTTNVERTNIIRRGKSRSSSTTTDASDNLSVAPYFRRRPDIPMDDATENVRKARTFTARSVTRRSDENVSSELPLVITTIKNNWRASASRRGSAKAKISERIPKSLDEDQLEDENYPEHFKILLKKQKPETVLSAKNLLKQEDPSYSKSNEIFEVTRAPARSRRLEQLSQENSDEILQVSRAIPKVRRVELKREDTARAALKSTRIEPRVEEKLGPAKNGDVNEVPFKSIHEDSVPEQLKRENLARTPLKSRRVEATAEETIRQVKRASSSRTPTKTQTNRPSNDVSRDPFKPSQKDLLAGEVETEVKPNEIATANKPFKPLFVPRTAKPYRPKPTTTTTRSTPKFSRKPEAFDLRAKYKPRVNARLQFPSLKTKTTPDETIKEDNEIVNPKPNLQPIRQPQITKSKNLALERPLVDTKPKLKNKFSSRYRGDAFSRFQQKTEPSKPIYTPTIPAVTTEPVPLQTDLPPSRAPKLVLPYNPVSHEHSISDNKYTGVLFDEKVGIWNMVEPVAGGLTRSEISVDSSEEHPMQSTVTVSIFEALADILSKTPKPSTTTTTTTTTTTSTTELPDIIQVPEIQIDSIKIPSTTVNTHLITDVDDEYTTNNLITKIDRNGRILNSVDNNQQPSTDPISQDPPTTTITIPQNTDIPQSPITTQTQTELTNHTTLALPPAQTEPTYTNNIPAYSSPNSFELTTLASNPPTSLPMPHLADALTTPGSYLVTRPQLISAISNFLDTSVQNASETIEENTTPETTTTTTLDTEQELATNTSTTSDASATLLPTTIALATDSPLVTISFLDLFTIQPKNINPNTEPELDVHPIYREPDASTTPASRKQKTFQNDQVTGRPINIHTFFGTQTYPSIAITGGTSTDRIREISSTFQALSSKDSVTSGVPTETVILSTTPEQDTFTHTPISPQNTSPKPFLHTQSLPIHLNSILGSTQKYDQTSPTKTIQTESTITIRSRFGNHRLPILPAGSFQFVSPSRNTTPTTITTSTTTTARTTSTAAQVSSDQQQQQLSNSITLPPEQQVPKQIKDFSVYGILPNNTVVRKRPVEVSRTLDVGLMVYGILPNRTVVRKYPNGTLAIVDSSEDVEVVDIDPKMLFNPFSELYRTSQSSLLLTTHRSTTSHRVIDSNHIASSSTEVPQSADASTATARADRRGNSIKDTEATTTTNGDDVDLIQLLNQNEDNLLNSTSLVESNTENAVLLDLLKRKYLNTGLSSKSSNVVSLTTIKNVVEESSIQANKDEAVSENTLTEEREKDISSTTSSEEDLLENLFATNDSAVPILPNIDDDNIITSQFDTFNNVGDGSISVANKGRTLDFSDRSQLYPIQVVMDVQNTTTKLIPINTFATTTSATILANDTYESQEDFLAEVNRTRGDDVENSTIGLETASRTPDRWSKIIDFGILESEIDQEGNGDYFMDPEDRFEIDDEQAEEGSGDSGEWSFQTTTEAENSPGTLPKSEESLIGDISNSSLNGQKLPQTEKNMKSEQPKESLSKSAPKESDKGFGANPLELDPNQIREDLNQTLTGSKESLDFNSPSIFSSGVDGEEISQTSTESEKSTENDFWDSPADSQENSEEVSQGRTESDLPRGDDPFRQNKNEELLQLKTESDFQDHSTVYFPLDYSSELSFTTTESEKSGETDFWDNSSESAAEEDSGESFGTVKEPEVPRGVDSFKLNRKNVSQAKTSLDFWDYSTESMPKDDQDEILSKQNETEFPRVADLLGDSLDSMGSKDFSQTNPKKANEESSQIKSENLPRSEDISELSQQTDVEKPRGVNFWDDSSKAIIKDENRELKLEKIIPANVPIIGSSEKPLVDISESSKVPDLSLGKSLLKDSFGSDLDLVEGSGDNEKSPDKVSGSGVTSDFWGETLGFMPEEGSGDSLDLFPSTTEYANFKEVQITDSDDFEGSGSTDTRSLGDNILPYADAKKIVDKISSAATETPKIPIHQKEFSTLAHSDTASLLPLNAESNKSSPPLISTTPSPLESEYLIPVKVLYPDDYFEQLAKFLEHPVHKNLSKTNWRVVPKEAYEHETLGPDLNTQNVSVVQNGTSDRHIYVGSKLESQSEIDSSNPFHDSDTNQRNQNSDPIGDTQYLNEGTKNVENSHSGNESTEALQSFKNISNEDDSNLKTDSKIPKFSDSDNIISKLPDFTVSVVLDDNQATGTMSSEFDDISEEESEGLNTDSDSTSESDIGSQSEYELIPDAVPNRRKEKSSKEDLSDSKTDSESNKFKTDISLENSEKLGTPSDSFSKIKTKNSSFGTQLLTEEPDLREGLISYTVNASRTIYNPNSNVPKNLSSTGSEFELNQRITSDTDIKSLNGNSAISNRQADVDTISSTAPWDSLAVNSNDSLNSPQSVSKPFEFLSSLISSTPDSAPFENKTAALSSSFKNSQGQKDDISLVRFPITFTEATTESNLLQIIPSVGYEDEIVNSTDSSDPRSIVNSTGLLLDPVESILDTFHSKVADKNPESDQHVVPRKGVDLISEIISQNQSPVLGKEEIESFSLDEANSTNLIAVKTLNETSNSTIVIAKDSAVISATENESFASLNQSNLDTDVEAHPINVISSINPVSKENLNIIESGIESPQFEINSDDQKLDTDSNSDGTLKSQESADRPLVMPILDLTSNKKMFTYLSRTEPSSTEPSQSFSDSTKPPTVYYPMSRPKMQPPDSIIKAAIVMPTNMQAVVESTTEPKHVEMIFPKNAKPRMNEPLPGQFNRMFTENNLKKLATDRDKSVALKSFKETKLGLQSPNENEQNEDRTVTANGQTLKEVPIDDDNDNDLKGRPLKAEVFSKVTESKANETPLVEQKNIHKSLILTNEHFSDTSLEKGPDLNLDSSTEEEFNQISSNDENTALNWSTTSRLPLDSLFKSNGKTNFNDNSMITEKVFVPGGVPKELLATAEVYLSSTEPMLMSKSISQKTTPEFSGDTLSPTSATADKTGRDSDNTYQVTLNLLESALMNVGNDDTKQEEKLILNGNSSQMLSEEETRKKDDDQGDTLDFQQSSDKAIAPSTDQDGSNLDLDKSLIDQINNDKNPASFSPQKETTDSTIETSISPNNSEMSENFLAHMRTINSSMSSASSNISMSKLNPASGSSSSDDNFIPDEDLPDSKSTQHQYSLPPIKQITQQSEYEEWRTKTTPLEVIYTATKPELSIEAQTQNHTDTQYTIQQNHFQETSTISSLENNILIDNLKNSPTTITEQKRVDYKTTPTIILVTPGTIQASTTETVTTPSTTSTTTTPSTTSTTSTTPSTTTTTSMEPPTTMSTTSSTSTTTTTPIETTVSTAVFIPTENLRTTSEPKVALSSVSSELERNIKLLEQLLALQASLKPKTSTSTSTTTTTTPSPTTTTTTTSTTTTTTTTTPPPPTTSTETPTKATSNSDDIAFLNTLRQLLLRQQQAAKQDSTTSTSTPRTTSSTTTFKPITISQQNLQDLLNSFSTPSYSTTTQKPIGQDDKEFLSSLRDIGRIRLTTSAPPTFANRIIELALQNRQTTTPMPPVYIPARVSSTTPAFTPMPEFRRPTLLPTNEIESHRKDQASLSADLSLLSTLLGRPISLTDLPKLTQQYRRPSPVTRNQITTIRTTTTTTTTTEKPMTRDEIAEIEKNLNLLSSLLGRPVSLSELPLIMQDIRSGRRSKGTASGSGLNSINPATPKPQTTSRPKTTHNAQSPSSISQEEVIDLLKDGTPPEQLNIYGKTNDAVLAAVLKQRGIGPSHNNIPINDLFVQSPTPTPYRTTRAPPRTQPPPTQRRPLLDGLAWLWRAWQDTAPGTRPSRNNHQPTAAASTRLESPLAISAYAPARAPAAQTTGNSGEGGEYADLQYPQTPSFGQGNGLLTAAFGVTKAVTQFLGAAFQGAAKSVQSAFSAQAVQQNGLIGLSG